MNTVHFTALAMLSGVVAARAAPRTVGMGSYNMDSHNVQRYVDARGFARNEGDIQVPPGGRYPISCLSPDAGTTVQDVPYDIPR